MKFKPQHILVEQYQDDNGRFIYKVIDKDTNKELAGVLSISFDIDVNRVPRLQITTLDNLEFDGKCHVTIRKVDK